MSTFCNANFHVQQHATRFTHLDVGSPAQLSDTKSYRDCFQESIGTEHEEHTAAQTIAEFSRNKLEEANIFLMDSSPRGMDNLPVNRDMVSYTSTQTLPSCITCPSLSSGTLFFSDVLTDDNIPTIINSSLDLASQELGVSSSLQSTFPSRFHASKIQSNNVTPLCDPNPSPTTPSNLDTKGSFGHLLSTQDTFAAEPKRTVPFYTPVTALDVHTPPLLQNLHSKVVSTHPLTPQSVLINRTQPRSFVPSVQTPSELDIRSLNQHPRLLQNGLPQSAWITDATHEQRQASAVNITTAKQHVRHGPSFDTPDYGLLAQELLGTYPVRESLTPVPDCWSVLSGSSSCGQHCPHLQGNLPLHAFQGPGQVSAMPRPCGHNRSQDAQAGLQLHHPHREQELLSSSVPPFQYNGMKAAEPGRTALYNQEDFKDMNCAAIGMLSDSQHSSMVQEVHPYSREEKDKRIKRYREKRPYRNFSKRIKYDCRKKLADSRPRIKGRFAKSDDT